MGKRAIVIVLAGVGLAAVAGAIAFPYGKTYVSEQVFDRVAEQILTEEEIEQLRSDPEVQRLLDEFAASEAEAEAASASASAELSAGENAASGSNAVNSAGAASGAVLSKEEAFDLITSQYSVSEMRDIARAAQDGLTEEEKLELKADFEASFTPEEIEKLKRTAVVEFLKRSEPK
ncbi:MAG TPA: hypothetical protein VEZ72_24485 [Paenibacillus sp.]|nr:hypothetical protein [Paenibacillus sp.]